MNLCDCWSGGGYFWRYGLHRLDQFVLCSGSQFFSGDHSGNLAYFNGAGKAQRLSFDQLLFLSALLLCLLNQQYALLGLFLGMLGINLKYVADKRLSTNLYYWWHDSDASFTGSVFYDTQWPDKTLSAYHSMTRGVLMTAANPEQALEEFFN